MAFRIYISETGETVGASQTRGGLNRCMDSFDRKGVHTSYEVITTEEYSALVGEDVEE